jgi:hypothetical protein
VFGVHLTADQLRADVDAADVAGVLPQRIADVVSDMNEYVSGALDSELADRQLTLEIASQSITWLMFALEAQGLITVNYGGDDPMDSEVIETGPGFPVACTQVHEHDPVDCAPETLSELGAVDGS